MGEGEGCARTWVRLPFHPHIYIRAREKGADPLRSNLRRGGGQGGCLAPQGKPPPLGFPQTLGAWALGGRRPTH